MKPRVIVVLAAVLLAATSFVLTRNRAAVPGLPVTAPMSSDGGSTLVVYKSPSCGCCGDWIDHMKESGFAVEVHDVQDVSPIKRELGVGQSLWSCHTAKIGGYVLEGHVPAEQVVRLLAEKPAIRGIAVPGMPIGSPGMDEGYDRSTWQDYDVVAFDAQGATSVYAHVKHSGE